jgi:hypothetical protein
MTVHEILKGDRTMKRLAIRALGLAALLALSVSGAWAGSDERKGTGGAAELLIPVGPRSAALGPAAATDVAGAEATFWNPAGLAHLENTEALFSYTSYLAGMRVNYAAVATRLGTAGTLGLSAKVLSIGDVIVTTEAAPEGTGEVFSPTFTVLGASYARAFTDRILFGGTVNFVNERILSMSATGVALDFGVQYLTGWNGLKLAMTMKNFGNSMEFDGENLEVSIQPPGSEPTASNRIVRFTTAKFEMPSYFTLSAGYDAFRQGATRLTLLGAFQSNNFFGDNLSVAGEWSYRETFALRGSWYGSILNELNPTTGDESLKFKSGDDLYTGASVGGGLYWKSGDTSLGVDVAYHPIREFFDDVVEVGLRVKF